MKILKVLQILPSRTSCLCHMTPWHLIFSGRIDAASAELKTRSDQFDAFAKSHGLPEVLTQRVKLYLNELYQAKKGINTAKIMADFPPALKNQVMMHLFTPLLLDTAYFNFIEKNLIEKLSQYLELRI